MSQFTQKEIKTLIDAVKCWETRYRCSFCSDSQYEKEASALKTKLQAMLSPQAAEPEPEETGFNSEELDAKSTETLEAMQADAIKVENYELAGQIKEKLEIRKKSQKSL